MSGSYQLLLNGQAADSTLYTLVTSIEVEESMDLPGALQLQVPVSVTSGGDLGYVNDPRFAPLASVAVVATPPAPQSSIPVPGAGLLGGATPPAAQCIFDGYVLSQKLHLDRGTTASTLAVWAQDATWMMNLTEQAREWVDVTDDAVAASIFGDYGITPSDQNTTEDSPSHTEAGHSLMQRATDIQFLRMLAQRNGKFCRVTCADTPNNRTGYFAAPDLGADPAATLSLNDPQAWTVNELDITWDATAATSVNAAQALFTDSDRDGVSANLSSSGLASLGDRDLATFTGKPMTVMLAAPVDDAGELTLRAQGVLRESGWFVRCEGESDVQRLGVVLRAGMVVAVADIGSLHSGNYLVWSVRHKITPDVHTMRFVLVRNAVGAAASGASSGALSALAGAL
jgi:phage protein D